MCGNERDLVDCVGLAPRLASTLGAKGVTGWAWNPTLITGGDEAHPAIARPWCAPYESSLSWKPAPGWGDGCETPMGGNGAPY